MKKLIYCLGILVMFACSNHDFPEFDMAEQITKDYNAAFVYNFGEPAKNQSWGFDNYVLPLTRAAQPNANQWGTQDDNGKYANYPKPADITDDERAAVLAVFNQKGEESYTALIDLQNFFVQQVYCGPEGAKMTELAAVVDYQMNVINWWPLEEEKVSVNPFNDIVNNFNNGAYSGNTEQGCMLMWNSSTLDWTWKSTQGGGERFHNWRMEYIPGYGYYVGFDFQSNKQGSEANENEYFERDYIYNDWIIKIVPGLGWTPPTTEQPVTPNKYTVRIIGEDLSASDGSDFDFNDVVFDASYIEGVDTTYITILAAGGELPLYIEDHEIHEALGLEIKSNGTYPMANTGKETLTVEPKTIKLGKVIAPWDIEIRVFKNGYLLPLTADTGSPASKIAVDPGFKWCDERDNIEEVYPKFSNWVVDTTITNWWK